CITRSLDYDDTPPDLHSFPTRRSSDLWNRWRSRSGVVAMDLYTSLYVGVCLAVLVWHVRRRRRLEHQSAKAQEKTGAAEPASLRSEEHTSELQSRRDLVCRLLLDKKNK